MSADLSDEVIAKVPSRYYRVPRYFFTVLTVAHNRRYRPTLLPPTGWCAVVADALPAICRNSPWWL